VRRDADDSEIPVFELRVRSSLDAFTVRNAVRQTASSLGFDRTAVSELAIAASELTTNIVKYGVEGTLSIATLRSVALGPGLVLIASDRGPPFHDFETALRDHHDDRGPLDVDARRAHRGLASGLGAVVRFTHAIEHLPSSVGKSIRAIRFLRTPARLPKSK